MYNLTPLLLVTVVIRLQFCLGARYVYEIYICTCIHIVHIYTHTDVQIYINVCTHARTYIYSYIYASSALGTTSKDATIKKLFLFFALGAGGIKLHS